MVSWEVALAKIPFNVSARTARLIGRENVSNAEGAIIELVKNAYDADAKNCIVYFDNSSIKVKDSISSSEYVSYEDKLIDPLILRKAYIYDESENLYRLIETKNLEKEDVKENKRIISLFKNELSRLADIYIIDDGEGMTADVIKKHWMTIGTNNKELDIETTSGRTKTGAKGIGRFALDRLGSKSSMLTEPKGDKNKLNYWTVDWTSFEDESKSINDIKAELESRNGSLIEVLTPLLMGYTDKEGPDLKAFSKGTSIKLSKLRDYWDDYAVRKIFTSLEALIPAEEERTFNVYVFSSEDASSYGKVTGTVCEDYDYKVEATVDANQSVNLTIKRNEIDMSKVDLNLFNRPNMQKENFTKDAFEKKEFTILTSLNQLIPGYSDIDGDNTLELIGPFTFTFYFMKRTYTRKDKNIFCYKDFNVKKRKSWLEEFSGIKIFRDDFRVRPYGEKSSNAHDWLGLGPRQASSPAAVSKLGGGYKARPYNLSGTIRISRTENRYFVDKSSREGFQENKVFDVFKEILKALIAQFEDDRSYIARELKALAVRNPRVVYSFC